MCFYKRNNMYTHYVLYWNSMENPPSRMTWKNCERKYKEKENNFVCKIELIHWMVWDAWANPFPSFSPILIHFWQSLKITLKNIQNSLSKQIYCDPSISISVILTSFGCLSININTQLKINSLIQSGNRRVLERRDNKLFLFFFPFIRSQTGM